MNDELDVCSLYNSVHIPLSYSKLFPVSESFPTYNETLTDNMVIEVIPIEIMEHQCQHIVILDLEEIISAALCKRRHSDWAKGIRRLYNSLVTDGALAVIRSKRAALQLSTLCVTFNLLLLF